MDSKLIEAALLAMSEVDASSRGEAEARKCVEAAILAFLDAAMGDEGVVAMVARAMLADELKASKPVRDFDETWADEQLIWISNARAALSALD